MINGAHRKSGECAGNPGRTDAPMSCRVVGGIKDTLLARPLVVPLTSEHTKKGSSSRQLSHLLRPLPTPWITRYSWPKSCECSRERFHARKKKDFSAEWLESHVPWKSCRPSIATSKITLCQNCPECVAAFAKAHLPVQYFFFYLKFLFFYYCGPAAAMSCRKSVKRTWGGTRALYLRPEAVQYQAVHLRTCTRILKEGRDQSRREPWPSAQDQRDVTIFRRIWRRSSTWYRTFTDRNLHSRQYVQSHTRATWRSSCEERNNFYHSAFPIVPQGVITNWRWRPLDLCWWKFNYAMTTSKARHVCHDLEHTEDLILLIYPT